MRLVKHRAKRARKSKPLGGGFHSFFRYAIVACFLWGMGIIAPSATYAAQSNPKNNCDDKVVIIKNASPAETAAACRALTNITEFFGAIGFDLAPRVTIRFVERASDAAHYVHGYFDDLHSQIVIGRQSDTKNWDIAWNDKLAYAFLCHEMAHFAIWEILSNARLRLRPEWHEFIAYAIQFELMDSDIRTKILTTYSTVQASKGFFEINEFISRMDPDRFAVIAYKTYRDNGGENFVARLLRADFSPPSFSYPFALLPGQVRGP